MGGAVVQQFVVLRDLQALPQSSRETTTGARGSFAAPALPPIPSISVESIDSRRVLAELRDDPQVVGAAPVMRARVVNAAASGAGRG